MKSAKTVIHKRNTSKSSISKVQGMLPSGSWDGLYEAKKNADLVFKKIWKRFISSFTECFPIVSYAKKYCQNYNKPCVTTHSLKLLRKRNKLHRKPILSPLPSLTVSTNLAVINMFT